jgi:hypothetical protein
MNAGDIFEPENQLTKLALTENFSNTEPLSSCGLDLAQDSVQMKRRMEFKIVNNKRIGVNGKSFMDKSKVQELRNELFSELSSYSGQVAVISQI